MMASLRKPIIGIVLSLPLARCSDPAGPCAAPGACELLGVDLYISRLEVIASGIDPATGQEVVDLDSVRIEYTVRNRGDSISEPATLVLSHRLRFASDSAEIPALEPGGSHIERRTLPSLAQYAFLFSPAGDTIRVTARLLAGDADTANNRADSAPAVVAARSLGDTECQRIAAELLELPPPGHLLRARREALAADVGSGVIVLAAGAPDARFFGTRADANLYYLAGLDVPASWLVVIVRQGRVESTVLYLPEASSSATGPVRAADVAEGTRTRCGRNLSQDLRELLPASGLPLALQWKNAAEEDTLIVSIGALPGVTTRGIWTSLNQQRMVKDSAEIERLRTAAAITAESIRDAVAVIRPGNTEADVAAAILAGFAQRGAAQVAFACIIASAANALILHYGDNLRTFTGGELVLIDVGAEYGRYAGDVTRTFPVSGTFSERQRALYELVLGAADTAIALVRPGSTRDALEVQARAYLRAHSGSLCGVRTCDHYFNHDLSHWLGLNVHDAGGTYMAALQPGTVLTIEPGIYLPDDGIGIRIEDDVLVTETGYEILSGAVPRTVAEIEALFAAQGPDTVTTAAADRKFD